MAFTHSLIDNNKRKLSRVWLYFTQSLLLSIWELSSNQYTPEVTTQLQVYV